MRVGLSILVRERISYNSKIRLAKLLYFFGSQLFSLHEFIQIC